MNPPHLRFQATDGFMNLLTSMFTLLAPVGTVGESSAVTGKSSHHRGSRHLAGYDKKVVHMDGIRHRIAAQQCSCHHHTMTAALGNAGSKYN